VTRPDRPRYGRHVTYVYAAAQSAQDPLSGLVVSPEIPGRTTGERPPVVPPDWVRVRVRAATLNHHDVWSLRGVGLPPDRLPMVLGTDAAGVDDEGREVIVHAVVAPPGTDGDETLDPRRSLLSERYPGTLAPEVWVPARNLVPKDPAITWAEAASLPTTFLTAYRMLVTSGGLCPGQTVLVQGTIGGVASAAIILARACGLRVWATGRDAARRARAEDIGAHATFEAGARLPEQVDAVLDTAGAATWAHSLRALAPGGVLLIAGATTGDAPPADLRRVFFRSLRIHGVTMGTRAELARVQALLVASGARPLIDSVRPVTDARAAVERLLDGTSAGKLVLERSLQE
jgi:NADPH:quinone reductase-like Zn-dependent oxidoreductase